MVVKSGVRAETIEHCVVTKEENANTVTCSCEPLVCKKMKEEK
jgi:hypothetical protein